MADQYQAIPIRQWDGSHGAPDELDAKRVECVRKRIESQAESRLERDRAIEENIRMLAGKQWDVWSPVLGQFVDPFRYLDDAARRWRQRPVVNLLAYWYLLTHARLTESQPIIAFQPATADRMDQALAETMETVAKTLWQGSMEMDANVVRAAAWLLAGGEAYFETAAEYPHDAAQYQMSGPATLSMMGADGQMIERDTTESVPYGSDGVALASLVPDGEDFGYDVPDFAAEGYEGQQPAMVREGEPKVNVYGPLEVWSEWGGNKAWEDRQWISIRRYLTPDKVQDLYGQEVKPDIVGSGGDMSGGVGTLQRMLFGSGHFGATNDPGKTSGAVNGFGQTGQSQYVTVDAMWEKPCPAYPQGRLLIVAAYSEKGGVVLHDSERPYETKAAGPIRRAQFVQMPGRAGFGSTPLEQLVPLQKAYNRGWAQILEHRNRCTNPILIYDSSTGFDVPDKNVPGAAVEADFSVANQPAFYLSPPALSQDAWRIQSMMFDLMMRMGSIAGTEGATPTDDPSGELINQLRFNADRPVSLAARSLAMALAGIGDDLVAVLRVVWPAEKIIAYAGEDNVLQTVTVTPELFSGRVNVRPDLSSALGETPQAKQARMERLLEISAISPQEFREHVRIPGKGRLAQSPDRVTCERFLVEIARGQPATSFGPLLQPWYDYDAFLETTRNHLAAPEFLNYDQSIQAELGQWFQMVVMARAQSQQFQAQFIVGPQATAQAAIQGQAESAHAATAPLPPDESSTTGPSSGPAKPGKQAA